MPPSTPLLDLRLPEILTLTFHFRALESLSFDSFPGIRIRGQIGFALHRLFGENSLEYLLGFRFGQFCKY
jgi:hypothetical protein